MALPLLDSRSGGNDMRLLVGALRPPLRWWRQRIGQELGRVGLPLFFLGGYEVVGGHLWLGRRWQVSWRNLRPLRSPLYTLPP